MNQSPAIKPPTDQDSRPIDRLLGIMAALRNPNGGCPWDLEQDFKSIAPYTVEEAYEVADAIERGDMKNVKEELGDLLLQIVFHAQMASEQEIFTFDDVATAISDKLIYRHPHVFGDQSAATPDEVVTLWDARKGAEKKHDSAIDGVTVGLPALLRAQKLQKKASKAGFVWKDLDGAWVKVEEELGELRAATIEDPKSLHTAEEIGDVLFCLVNYARMAGHDAESILTNTNRKFEKLFKNMEQVLTKEGKSLEQSSLEEMLSAWTKGKNL
jgi:MazG family protein